MKKIAFLTIFIFQFAVIANIANAICVCGNTPAPNITRDNCLGPACTWQEDSTNTQAPVVLDNPLPGVSSVPQFIGKIINALLGVVGSLALIMFIYGGFTWMLASGNESQVEKGRNILVWATIGLVVIFASYSLVHFVIKSIAQ